MMAAGVLYERIQSSNISVDYRTMDADLDSTCSMPEFPIRKAISGCSLGSSSSTAKWVLLQANKMRRCRVTCTKTYSSPK